MQFCAPDDGCGIHSKNVEQFAEINKLCNLASCWLHFGIYLGWTDPWTSNSCKSLTHCQLGEIIIKYFWSSCIRTTGIARKVWCSYVIHIWAVLSSQVRLQWITMLQSSVLPAVCDRHVKQSVTYVSFIHKYAVKFNREGCHCEYPYKEEMV
jgi:hypothetical protein